MFKYFQTTTILLLICFLLSAFVSYISYELNFGRRHDLGKKSFFALPIVPVLLVAPLMLVLGFKGFGVNLIYPLAIDATLSDLVKAAMVPALVLCIASGLFSSLTTGIKSELGFWCQKPFALMMTASGFNLKRMMRRLIIGRAITDAWMRTMPWLFGEMIIVEVVFNAPGLGLDAWTMAKQRNLGALFQSLMWLGVLYIVCVLVTQAIQRKIGKRLESYC